MVYYHSNITLVNAGISGVLYLHAHGRVRASRTSDVVALEVRGGSEFYSNDIVQIRDGFGSKSVWVAADGYPRKANGMTDGNTIASRNDIDGYLAAPAFQPFGTVSGTVARGNDSRFIEQRLHPLLSFEQSFENSNLSNWTYVTSGAVVPLRYMAQSRYYTESQVPSIGKAVAIDGNTGTTGNECGCSFQTTRLHYVASGSIIVFQHKIHNQSALGTARIGFWGNDQDASPNVNPSIGFCLEYDRGVSTTDWYLRSGGSGGSVTTLASGYILDEQWRYGAFVLGSDTVKFYRANTSGFILSAVLSGVNVPSSVIERQGSFFWQLRKTSGTGTRPHHIVHKIGKILDSSSYPLFPKS